MFLYFFSSFTSAFLLFPLAGLLQVGLFGLLAFSEWFDEEEEGLFGGSTFSAFVTLQSFESFGKTNSSSFLSFFSEMY